MTINQTIILDIKAIIANAQNNAIRAVDNERTIMYWHIGKRIFEEEQQGKERLATANALLNTFLNSYSQSMAVAFRTGS